MPLSMSSISADQDSLTTAVSFYGLLLFLSVVVGIVLYNAKILFFDGHHVFRHRLAGAVHLGLIVGGTVTATYLAENWHAALFFDIVLGLSGMWTTWTASIDFPHRYVTNRRGQSGTLSEKAIVTYDEMKEHLFYQFLNLWQSLYLHASFVYFQRERGKISIPAIGLLWLVTSPWLFRHRFPVHSFSNNWAQRTIHNTQSSIDNTMYRIKKWQYVFYKHVILHGLNISVCVNRNATFVSTLPWRLFWISLNTAYVMEFFLQSLVKRKVLTNTTMLFWNRWLMLVSSMAAAQAVLLNNSVRFEICLVSLVLNFCHRHHDVLNTVGIVVAFSLVARSLS